MTSPTRYGLLVHTLPDIAAARATPSPESPGGRRAERASSDLGEPEIEVLVLRARGATVGEIADALSVPERLASVCLGNIYDALEVSGLDWTGRQIALLSYLRGLKPALAAGYRPEAEWGEMRAEPTAAALLAVLDDDARLARSARRLPAAAPALLPAPPVTAEPARRGRAARRPGPANRRRRLVWWGAAALPVAALGAALLAGALGSGGAPGTGGPPAWIETVTGRTTARPPAEPAAALPFGQASDGRDLRLTALPPRSGGNIGTAPLAVVDFTLENTGGGAVDLKVPYGAFYLETAAGTRYEGHAAYAPVGDHLEIEGLRPGERRAFRVGFQNWDAFETLASSGGTFRVGTRGVAARIPAAVWRAE